MDDNIFLNADKIPTHVAIIMDGNGRWAQQHGQERFFGHQAGVEAVRTTLKSAAKLGIKYLTLYTFSTENWNRPKAEIELLMELLFKAIHNELDELIANNVRLLIAGRLSDLPDSCQEAIEDAIRKTSHNNGLTVILALSYSGHVEITDAVKHIVAENIPVSDITAETIQQHLYIPDVPNPDILIRTGGEQRISNFLLWQIAYTEMFFLPVMWPDFSEKELKEVIFNFQNRERRYGKTGEQVREH